MLYFSGDGADDVSLLHFSVFSMGPLLNLTRQWERVLHEQAAHSLDTWEEDEMMPYNPAVIQEGREGSLVSQVRIILAA